MANSNFIVQNGLQVGPLTIDAATGSITTSGNVNITGNLGVSQISKNDSSIGINDTGTGSNVSIIVDGTQEMVITSSGATITSGDLTLNAQGDLRFADSDSSNWVAFQAPATVATNVTWTLPAADGAANQALVTNGSGTLSWAAAGASITDDTTTNATRYILFDDATTGYATSVLVSSSKLTYNPSTGVVGATGLTATGTVTAATVNAATIGNTGALLTGTLQTASQTNITGLGNITTGTWNATTISTTRGGTGLTSFTSGGALYATSTSALTTGTLPVASGGTGTTTSTGTGSVVLSTSPSLTTPVLGAATGTSLAVTGTINASGAVTVASLAANSDVVVGGNLTVNGTTTTINASTLVVNDKNITLANVATPTDVTADGGGITVLGATNKTFNWVSAASAWTSSEDINVATGKGYEVNGTSVLNATTLGSGVVNSSLTSVGTIGTGTWQGSVIGSTYGGTGVNNGANTLTLGASVNINQNLRTSDKPTFAGLTTSAAIVPNANNTIDLGASGTVFATVYATTFSGVSTTAKYADLAENYAADAEYEPGTVVCFGGDAEVTVCDVDHCQKVAGVVSTAPAYLMNNDLGGVKAAVALQGRVPVKVVGSVRKGDMMVAAGNGRARAEANPKIGAVIGKALENFDGAEGVIEVVIGRV